MDRIIAYAFYRLAIPVDDSYRATDGVELRTESIDPS